MLFRRRAIAEEISRDTFYTVIHLCRLKDRKFFSRLMLLPFATSSRTKINQDLRSTFLFSFFFFIVPSFTKISVIQLTMSFQSIYNSNMSRNEHRYISIIFLRINCISSWCMCIHKITTQLSERARHF